jgi:hypothetical protein
MIQYKTCDGNQMSVSGHASSFNYPAKGKGSWMTTQVHRMLNCEIEEFNVTRDCTNCPIKSPFGILNLNPQSNNDHTTMQKDNRKSRSPYQIAALNLKDGFTRAKKKNFPTLHLK